MQDEPEQRDDFPAGEIDPITCIAFILIVFIIVPFTILSPFRYPATSMLDRMLSPNSGSVSASVRAPYFADAAGRTAELSRPETKID